MKRPYGHIGMPGGYTFQDSVPAGIYPDFAIDFSTLDLDEME